MQLSNTRHQASLSWLLPQGQAQTFVPRTPGTLRVIAGRAWVTMSHPHQAPAPEVLPVPAEYDLVLESTASLPLRAGQTVVMEAWSAEAATAAALVWEAAVFGPAAQQWQQTVAQPARELMQGLKQAGFAFGKMVQGLLRYSMLVAAGPYRLH